MNSNLSKQLVIFIGPAGSGKTSLTYSYGKWIEKSQNICVGYVNLDPAVKYLPYRCDVDVRDWVKTSDVMLKYRLGPNGALIKSVDMLLKYRDEIVARIARLDKSYILVDTPGQMELFLFRNTGPFFLEYFRKIGVPIAVLIFDPTLTYRIIDVVALQLMSMVVQFRLGIESIVVVNKTDSKDAFNLLNLIKDENNIPKRLKNEGGILSEMAEEFHYIIEKYKQATRLVKVSATAQIGMEELYDILHEIYCSCGDLT